MKKDILNCLIIWLLICSSIRNKYIKLEMDDGPQNKCFLKMFGFIDRFFSSDFNLLFFVSGSFELLLSQLELQSKLKVISAGKNNDFV